MTDFFETYRGTVRREELDEMGHMNVAYYLKKSSDSLSNIRFILGLTNKDLNQEGLAVIPLKDRIFFKREVHLGDTLFMKTGVRGLETNGGIRVVNLLENQENSTLAAQFETTIHLVSKDTGQEVPWPQEVLDRAHELTGSFPQVPAPEPFEHITLPTTQKDKLFTTYQGVISETDADVSGFAAPHAHITPFWTAFPNIFLKMGIDHREIVKNGVGSAALDYRLDYHRPVKQGTEVEIKSCLLEMGEKVFRFVHFMTDKNTGDPVTTVDVLGVLFDLNARKAIAFPEPYRKGGEAIIVKL